MNFLANSIQYKTIPLEKYNIITKPLEVLKMNNFNACRVINQNNPI